jgi:hypothetical protein
MDSSALLLTMEEPGALEEEEKHTQLWNSAVDVPCFDSTRAGTYLGRPEVTSTV